jgi:ADP-heptose:LPS heptosyltransferase
MEEAGQYLTDMAFPDYTLAYNLNNHPRSILASHLLSTHVVGAGDQGPLNPSRPPWVDYLRHVASKRGRNRIHLADAFCGICGVRPPADMPRIDATDSELPPDLDSIVNDSSLLRIGIVLGAGDTDRRVPVTTWCRLIEACAEHLPNAVCVLVGGAGEREAALALEDQLPSHCQARMLNCVGRTTLPQLAHVFNRCQWIVGSDTGPLHLGVACGAQAIGWYFSRARVHETGPYGVGHCVWQHQEQSHPNSWPVMETIRLIRHESVDVCPPEWELWKSHRDEWGMFYVNKDKPDSEVFERKKVWERLSNESSNLYSDVHHSLVIAGRSL